MQKFEVVRKDIQRVRITISKDRITVKVPVWATDLQENDAILIAKRVASDHPSPEHTLRAKICGTDFYMETDRKLKVSELYLFDLRLGGNNEK